jgi:predicted transcriptional regulator
MVSAPDARRARQTYEAAVSLRFCLFQFPFVKIDCDQRCRRDPLKLAIPVTLWQGGRMTIELPSEIATQLEETAQAQGVSVGQYVEKLVAETNLRRTQIAEFRAAVAERMASLNAGDRADGEEAMARLTADPAPR